MRLLLGFMLLLCFALPANAWTGVVVSVHDGDTITVRRDDSEEKVRIRLHGIDAPEFPAHTWKAQPYCKKAHTFVKAMLLNQPVAVIDMGYDKYTRTVAGIVSLPQGDVIQESLLREGLAWVYPKYCRNCDQWIEIEAEARDARKGLWRQNDPVPPWEWRHASNPDTAGR